MLGSKGVRLIGLFFILLPTLAVPVVLADEKDPWYVGPPDSQRVKAYEVLYAEYFEDIQAKLAREVNSSRLARARVVNVINKAVAHWKKHQRDHYEVSLTYLFVDGDKPLHYDFVIDGDRIRKLVYSK